MAVPRIVNPATNPNGYMTAIGAALAAGVMIYNAVSHHGIFDATVIVSLAGAVLALVSRNYVTPVKDPRDGNGTSLIPAPLSLLIPPSVPPGQPPPAPAAGP